MVCEPEICSGREEEQGHTDEVSRSWTARVTSIGRDETHLLTMHSVERHVRNVAVDPSGEDDERMGAEMDVRRASERGREGGTRIAEEARSVLCIRPHS